MPWPVDQGYVCIHYGLYQIGETKLKGDNPGITICTPRPGINAKSVFEGEVESVFNIGDIKAVMIRHGKYFTIYSNLSSVNVAKGTHVKTGQVIGKVAVDEDDGEGGKLEFVLMIESKNINPEPWLRK
jgi:murein DD-endopeptidase MepM/ murein hydrolase activator NlpD